MEKISIGYRIDARLNNQTQNKKTVMWKWIMQERPSQIESTLRADAAPLPHKCHVLPFGLRGLRIEIEYLLIVAESAQSPAALATEPQPASRWRGCVISFILRPSLPPPPPPPPPRAAAPASRARSSPALSCNANESVAIWLEGLKRVPANWDQ
ncbi:unnamed protein product, partial [Iphiclides podalirius]